MIEEVVALDVAALGATLDDIAEIGNRFPGSAGEATCRDYLLRRFTELGLDDVRLEPFDYLAFEPAAATCVALGSEELELECHPLQYTAAGEASGQAIYIGEATELDFSRLDRAAIELAGRIVLAHTVFPFDLVGQLEERGVAGFVHVCETPDGIVGNFTGALYPPPLSPPWPGRPTTYSGVTISHGAGRALISMLSCGPVELRIGHQGSLRDSVAHNLVGAIRGSDPEEVIVSAHYDSQAEGPCVYDNGSGLASLLETVRALRESRPRRRITFIASAAEEVGVWGATAYAHRHADELREAVGMVNLDGIASAYPAQKEIYSADAGMLRMAVETAASHGWKPDRALHRRTTFGDHAPFGDAGVPSCLIWRPDYPYYHSRSDVRALVDEVAIAETAGVSATLIHRLAQGANVPGAADAAPPKTS